MVQKRAMRSIFPSHNYEEALQKTKLPILAARREQLCGGSLNKVRTERSQAAGAPSQNQTRANQFNGYE